MQGHHAAERGGVNALKDQRHQKARDKNAPHGRQAQMTPYQQGGGVPALCAVGSAAVGDESEGKGDGGQRQQTEEQGHGGETEDIGQQPAAEHARQTAQPHKTVVAAHEIAAIVLP